MAMVMESDKDPRDGVYSYDQPSDGADFQASLSTGQNFTHTTVIVGQPTIQRNFVYASPPPNHLGLAIVTCLFCFFPTGICAIVSAVNSSNAAARGDMEGARLSSKSAFHLSITSIVLGIIAIAMTIILHLNGITKIIGH